MLYHVVTPTVVSLYSCAAGHTTAGHTTYDKSNVIVIIFLILFNYKLMINNIKFVLVLLQAKGLWLEQ